jgi:hypothetical protein
LALVAVVGIASSAADVSGFAKRPIFAGYQVSLPSTSVSVIRAQFTMPQVLSCNPNFNPPVEDASVGINTMSIAGVVGECVNGSIIYYAYAVTRRIRWQ